MHILSEYDRMESKRIRYMELFTRLEKEINELFDTASNLRIPWEGSAAKTYIIRVNTDALIISEILKSLHFAGEVLGMAISEYQRNEGEIAQLIADLEEY